MGNTLTSKRINTPVCRLAYPYIFEPDEKGKYRVVLLFDKQNFDPNFMKEILNEVKTLANVKYKGNIPATFRANPLKDGDVPNSTGNTPFKGYYYCNAQSNFKPGVVASYPDPEGRKKPDGTPAPMIITDANEIYGGVYARANIHAYDYNFQGNSGIGISINSIQKIKDGDRLGNGGGAANDFDCFETNEVQAMQDLDALVDMGI